MIKLLFWLAMIAGIIGYIAYRLRARTRPAPTRASPQPQTFESVRCRQCGVYLPIEKAIQREDAFFCSWEHAQQWQNKKTS